MVSFIWKIKSDKVSANPLSFPETIKFCNPLLQSTGNRYQSLFVFSSKKYKSQNLMSVICSFVSVPHIEEAGSVCLLMCVILRSLATHLAPSLH